MSEKIKLRPVAFYLPQFHPIPENDEWWGKGFTEWTNVTKAKPLFPGHYQPHLPADLGFYDLRLADAREAQARLASSYGIQGFCYYHYWFNGRRVLERPFDEVLSMGKPDFPFMLCWANENWTRNWDGDNKKILLQQVYSEEDDRRHMQWLAYAFRDKRYIRVDGKPVFLIYRAANMPNPAKTAEVWRDEARRQGIGEIYLCRVESFADERKSPAEIGFDAGVEFQPAYGELGLPLQRSKRWKFLRKLRLADRVYDEQIIFDYQAVAEKMLARPLPAYKRFPGVTPSWDNSARRKKHAVILKDASPALYEKWLKGAAERFTPPSAEENFIFINAWNEWAEGNHLEPCRKWGHAYLEATRRALSEKSQTQPLASNPPAEGKIALETRS
ncbi:MAG TPA: glycoside hydrolase family 99-like domain-containing protein [Verrucomicrobiae bacterium]|nr:glycoside hydrolase family 99-like domain-containing protein [Verrucomicrobiae bacterium]